MLLDIDGQKFAPPKITKTVTKARISKSRIAVSQFYYSKNCIIP